MVPCGRGPWRQGQGTVQLGHGHVQQRWKYTVDPVAAVPSVDLQLLARPTGQLSRDPPWARSGLGWGALGKDWDAASAGREAAGKAQEITIAGPTSKPELTSIKCIQGEELSDPQPDPF